MSRGKLMVLLLLGVGLVAILARRSAASIPQGGMVEPGALPTETGGGFDWGSLALPDFSALFSGGGATPTQPAPASQAPGADFAVSDYYSPPSAGMAYDIWGGLDQQSAEALPADTGSGAVDIWGGIPMDTGTTAAAPGDPDANVAAFLKLIRTTEGTENNPRGWSPYAVTYAYAFEITDFSRHPAMLGWQGVPLPPQYCYAAGLSPGCVSTAAGAYQFNFPTWRDIGGIDLDFSPASQDWAATQLLARIGALDAIRAGDFNTALQLASSRWASLPYASAGQPKVSVADASAIYQNAGGTVA
jgi:muramidase (phage lysozyme)